MYEYVVDEWSVDTREWEIKSPRQLTYEEVFEIYNEHVGFSNMHYTREEHTLSGKFEGIRVVFTGTRFGDNSEYEMYGDFKEEEE